MRATAKSRVFFEGRFETRPSEEKTISSDNTEDFFLGETAYLRHNGNRRRNAGSKSFLLHLPPSFAIGPWIRLPILRISC